MPDVQLDPADYETVFEDVTDDKGTVTGRRLLMLTLTATGRKKATKLMGNAAKLGTVTIQVKL